MLLLRVLSRSYPPFPPDRGETPAVGLRIAPLSEIPRETISSYFEYFSLSKGNATSMRRNWGNR